MAISSLNVPLVIIGSGSWGTALAIHLARNGKTVHLWGHNKKDIAQLRLTKSNPRFLPNIYFPDQLYCFEDLEEALEAKDICIAVPSIGFRDALTLINRYRKTEQRVMWVTKGLDAKMHTLLNQTAVEILGEVPIAVLSGPSFAREVALGLPTAVTIASLSSVFAQDLLQLLHSKNFRIYLSSDVIGVCLGGAIKNVLAIAVGISDGLGLGANARAALITRGLAEMMRLGSYLGANKETFMGLSGLGDLVLTCTDNQSRNRRFGFAIGEGKDFEKAHQEIQQVVEGYTTANELYQLTHHLDLDLPISTGVYKILYEKASPTFVVNALLSRDPKSE